MTIHEIPEESGIMEHRYYARVHAPVSVTISTRDGNSSRGVVRNISYGGILVEMDDPIEVARSNGFSEKNIIAKNTVVIVEFDEDKFSVSLLAMVLRHSDKTAALMFMAHMPELRPFLHQLSALDDTPYTAAYKSA
jgi:c-di-GMP-binding flagellar brake protein YcgR